MADDLLRSQIQSLLSAGGQAAPAAPAAPPAPAPSSGGIDYNDRLGDSDPDGLRQIIMEAGASRSRILARGLGPLLPFPFMPLVPPVTVQLRSENGECWGAVYSLPRINDGVQFKANPD